MAQKPFAGAHTAKKLEKLEEYLKAYLRVFKNQTNVRTIYFDAFAGTGDAPLAGSIRRFRSTRKARLLSLDPRDERSD